MSLIHFYYDPVTELERLFNDTLAARIRSRPCASSTEAKQATLRQHDIYRPRLDLHESKDTNTVVATFELPGLTSEGVTIDVHRNRLTVSGEFTRSDAQEEKGYLIRERHSGKFTRTLQLPFGTKLEDVKAKMENGVLTITFPKTSPGQEAQRIIVQ